MSAHLLDNCQLSCTIPACHLLDNCQLCCGGSALQGYDVATQKQQFPLLALAPQFVNIRQDYWLQDVSSSSVSSYFARVDDGGVADGYVASVSLGVRPSVTLSYI